MRWTLSAFQDLSAAEVHDLLALRQRVFVVEQQCAYADVDGLDPGAWHLRALDGEQGVLVATLRVLGPGVATPEVSIGRVVVREDRRGAGLGRELMKRGIGAAQDRFGAGPIRVAAQSHLERFYRSLGFVLCGAEFVEDGIPHLPMRLAAAGATR